MLKHLFIQNFVLMKELSLDFNHGFSAFTGETGAGKSILIDAISVLCSQRASADFVSHGESKAIIEGTFDISHDDHAKRVLDEAGFLYEDEVTFTREIDSSGKSQARINHRIVTFQMLRDCLLYQIDIHGQRDTAYLLEQPTHLRLLDAYCDHPALLEDVKKKYNIYHDLVVQKENALQDTYNESDLEFFRHQINEIDSAKLVIGEDVALEEKEKQYQSIKLSLDKYQRIFQLFDENINDSFYTLNKEIQSLEGDTKLEELISSFQDSYYNINDVIEQLRSNVSDIDMSQAEIDAMEERLYDIQKLKRKYGSTIEDILAKKEELEDRISVYDNRQDFLERVDKEISEAYQIYQTSADKLSKSRKKHAKSLDKLVQANLNDLMLKNARFETHFESCEAKATGLDEVEFLIAMNKGEELKSLRTTASGGELSRLMLGLKEIFTKYRHIETVIFDEIDAGVSGSVASAIGKKMKSLSQDSQVFAITHLSPVAAHADHHYLVHKDTKKDKTETSVKLLNHDEIIDELALISSGEITDSSRSAAQELYERSQENG